MARLTIEKNPWGMGMTTVKIGGFAEGELNELKSMEHYEAKYKLLDMLDQRNDGQGTRWHNGNGVYGLWFDNEYAFFQIGNSCD